MAKSGRLKLQGNNIYGHGLPSTTVTQLTRKATETAGEKTQNKGYYAVQGHSRSSRSVSIESPYATSY